MRGRDRTIAEIATQFHGVVTRRRLLAAGLSRGEIDARVVSGALIVVYRGVYRVGHRAPSREATYLAAVEACGAGSLLYRRAAGHLHALLRGPAPSPEVVTRGERRIEESGRSGAGSSLLSMLPSSSEYP
jgi:hypothetical protein